MIIAYMMASHADLNAEDLYATTTIYILIFTSLLLSLYARLKLLPLQLQAARRLRIYLIVKHYLRLISIHIY